MDYSANAPVRCLCAICINLATSHQRPRKGYHEPQMLHRHKERRSIPSSLRSRNQAGSCNRGAQRCESFHGTEPSERSHLLRRKLQRRLLAPRPLWSRSLAHEQPVFLVLLRHHVGAEQSPLPDLLSRRSRHQRMVRRDLPGFTRRRSRIEFIRRLALREMTRS